MRKSISLLAAFVLCGCIASAQSEQQQQPPPSTETKKPHPLDPADVNTITGRDTNLMPFSRAPKPGHPLDSNDVATLTGRPQRSQWLTKAPRPGHALDPADVETLSSNYNEARPYTPYVPYIPFADVNAPTEWNSNSWNVANPSLVVPRAGRHSFFFPGFRIVPEFSIIPVLVNGRYRSTLLFDAGLGNTIVFHR